MYYRNAQSALVVYDLTKPTSLIKAKHWVAELQRQASPGIVIALVGNKLDLCNDGPGAAAGSSAAGGGDDDEDLEAESGDARKVTTEEGRSFAEEEGLLFYETSAKKSTNVLEVFTAIANKIPESALKSPRGVGRAAAEAGQRGEGSRVNLGQKKNAETQDSCAC